MYTTLNKFKNNSDVDEGGRLYWEEVVLKKLMDGIGKTETDDEELSISRILTILPYYEVISCLKTVEGFQREKMLLSVWYARKVQHQKIDIHQSNYDIIIQAINVAEKFALGVATEDELLAEQNRLKKIESDGGVLFDVAFLVRLLRLLRMANYVLQGDVFQVWRIVDLLMPMRLQHGDDFDNELRRMVSCIEEGQQYKID